MKAGKKFIISICIFFVYLAVNAQFYNGLQMTFGKNRVQYNDFYWSYYRFEKFDIYFNQFGKNISQYTALYTEDKLIEIENFFDFKLDKRLIFVVYNKLTDFRQSNIGLITGKEDDDNIGGVINILDNKVFLYFEGDHKKFEKQINKAIAKVILSEMLIGGNIRDRVTNMASLNIPDWYLQGLISYISEEWNFEYENKLKDGLLSGKYKHFTKLSGEDAKIAGHSLWRYLGDTYGKSIIPSIVYLSRLNKNSNKGFYNVLGIRMRLLIKNWKNHYLNEFEADTNDREFPDSKKVLKRPKKDKIHQNAKLSPNGKYIVYSTNENGKYKIYLYDTETNKRKKIFKNGYKLSQIPDYSFPVIAWHPSNRLLAFITEESGGLKLYFYNINTKELIVKNFLYFEKVFDFSYSNNGLYFVLSGLKNGKTDIFIHNIAAASNEQITNDIADDKLPRFINNSKKIIFSSNRVSDTLTRETDVHLNILSTYDLFIYDYKNKSDILTRLTREIDINNYSGYETEKDKFIYLSDESGVINRHIIHLDSMISHIDTTIHYRYYTNKWPITNYQFNINEQNVSSDNKQIAEIVRKKQRQYILFDNLKKKRNDKLKKTKFRIYQSKKILKADSVSKAKNSKIFTDDVSFPDSVVRKLQDSTLYVNSTIDVNNYIFEREKRFTFNEKLQPYINLPSAHENEKKEFPPIKIYQPSFYSNYVVSQADFGFMSNSYQPYSGRGTYFNPGLNGLFKIGTNDLFEDYKLIGGFSISPNLTSNEYLISFENLKTRLDKQFIFHRQAIVDTLSDQESGIFNAKVKNHSHNLMFVLKYPYSQVKSLKGTFNIRHDRSVYLAEDQNTLENQNINKVWTGLKVEYIFDNTLKTGINTYDGTRYKIFGEAYKMVNENKSDLFVLGADFRHYQKIHRELIYAGRIAGSTSFGSARLLYYLGGVDNWAKMIPYLNIFDNSIPVSNTTQYAFQTIATNMRGYLQNIRNGNNFLVINNELRFPFIRYFARYPISSKFWSSLQLISFFDVGSAWAGLNPYGKQNAYDTIRKQNGNITVTVDSNRNPIVYGYGYGFRMQLFGYFIRIDKAWGSESQLPHIWHVSLSLDF